MSRYQGKGPQVDDSFRILESHTHIFAYIAIVGRDYMAPATFRTFLFRLLCSDKLTTLVAQR